MHTRIVPIGIFIQKEYSFFLRVKVGHAWACQSLYKLGPDDYSSSGPVSSIVQVC